MITSWNSNFTSGLRRGTRELCLKPSRRSKLVRSRISLLCHYLFLLDFFGSPFLYAACNSFLQSLWFWGSFHSYSLLGRAIFPKYVFLQRLQTPCCRARLMANTTLQTLVVMNMNIAEDSCGSNTDT